jgi:hypothetical protein
MTPHSPLTWAVRTAHTFGILGSGQSYENLLFYLKSEPATWTMPKREVAPQWVSALVDIR